MRRFSVAATVLFVAYAAPAQAQQGTPEPHKVIGPNRVGVSKEASGGWTRSGAIAAQAARALAGVWKEVEVTVTTADSTWTTEISQPNLTIMTTRHYSRLAVRGERPRETLPQAASAEQLLAAWRPFHATGGTYVVSGPTEITETIIVSKSPNETAEGTVYTSTFELESDILYRTFTTPSGEFRVKYIRVEASAPLSCKLVGRWESVAASRGGLGIMGGFTPARQARDQRTS